MLVRLKIKYFILVLLYKVLHKFMDCSYLKAKIEKTDSKIKTNSIDYKLNSIDKNLTKFMTKTREHFIARRVVARSKHSYCHYDVWCVSEETQVGDYVSIGSGACLGVTQHPVNWLSTHPFCYFEPRKLDNQKTFSEHQYIKPLKIGNDVWIGKNAIIMDGITVGDGAIIGANAVVTKDVPPYAIVAGVPAKIIRYRFDEETIKDLLEIKWWEMDESKLIDLPFHDVKASIEMLKNINRQENCNE